MASSFILCLNKLFFFHKEKAFHFHKTILKVLSMTLSGTSAWIEASIKICFIFEHFVLQLLCSGWRAAFIEMTGISIIWSAGQWDPQTKLRAEAPQQQLAHGDATRSLVRQGAFCIRGTHTQPWERLLPSPHEMWAWQRKKTQVKEQKASCNSF